MEGCLRSTGSRKSALDLAEKGMLQKDYGFEVVRYPGADKRGHLWSGQVFFPIVTSLEEDTGGTVPYFSSPERGSIDAAQLI